MISQYQKFVIETISRKQINFAYYNPRKISDTAKKKLKDFLKNKGLIESLTWNKQTGNLVSGHQRLAILDSLERNDEYELQVNVIDVDLKTEIEYNVFLNNTSAQGQFDKDILNQIHLEFPEIDFVEDLKFDKLDINFLDLDVDLSNSQQINKTSEQLQEIKENNIKQKKQDAESNSNYGEQNDYILTIVFNNNKEKQNFNAKIGIDRKEKYIKGSKIFDIVKEEYRF